jgi:hypothetical protein
MGSTPFSVLAIATVMSKFKIVQISDETTNGNNIVKMQRKVSVSTPLGDISRSETYYMAVKAGTVKVKLDDEVEVNPADFAVTERPFETPEGEMMMLKWLSVK